MYIFIRFLRIALLALLVYFLYRILFKNEGFKFFKKRKKQHPRKRLEGLKKDPVCGTYIPENQAIRYKDQYFCSEECKEKYQTLKDSG
ncbi:MAG: hypothetical protein KAT34_10240 [Candidatus Aminicenantes bacterium]|nr:hypothetical protein [Candidatus Aminicenantes bacterium]